LTFRVTYLLFASHLHFRGDPDDSKRRVPAPFCASLGRRILVNL